MDDLAMLQDALQFYIEDREAERKAHAGQGFDDIAAEYDETIRAAKHLHSRLSSGDAVVLGQDLEAAETELELEDVFVEGGEYDFEEGEYEFEAYATAYRVGEQIVVVVD